MSDDVKISALEAALAEQTRLRFEAEVKLQIAKAEQFSATESYKRAQFIARAMVELWYACRKDSAKRLSDTEMGGNLNFSTNGLIGIAEDEMLASIGVKTDVYSEQRALETRITAWRAGVR